MGAYPLSVPELRGRKYVVAFVLLPMYFGGGLIPTFLLMSKLNLYNNIFAIIVPASFNICEAVLFSVNNAKMIGSNDTYWSPILEE